MRFPRVQFTIRQLMIVVGIVGFGLALDRAINGYYVEAILSGILFAVLFGPPVFIFVAIFAILHGDRAQKRIE